MFLYYTHLITVSKKVLIIVWKTVFQEYDCTSVQKLEEHIKKHFFFFEIQRKTWYFISIFFVFLSELFKKPNNALTSCLPV